MIRRVHRTSIAKRAVTVVFSNIYKNSNHVLLKQSLSYSTNTNKNTNTILLRDFLRRCLYHKQIGYFNKTTDNPIGTIIEPMPFNEFIDREDYLLNLQKRWSELGPAWLTPSEIFKPFYANAIAKYLISEQQLVDRKDMKIIEIGGGTGTFALGLLNYIRANNPEVYATMKYVSIDVSEYSLTRQALQIKEHGHDTVWYRTEKPFDITRDATDENSTPANTTNTTSCWREIMKTIGNEGDGCFVIGLELLDNLVHDKVIMSVKNGNWLQARVLIKNNEKREEYEPIEDDEIEYVLSKVLEVRKSLPFWTHLSDAMKGVFKQRDVTNSNNSSTSSTSSSDDVSSGVRNQTIYLPTGLSFALKNLRKFVPGHRLVLADFDSLPESKMHGLNAPVVASQSSGGKTHDRMSYLEGDMGSSDVFFPTCFETLKKLDANKNGKYMTTKAFMQKWSDSNACLTRNGYNPLLSDFSNTKFYLS